MQWKPENAKNEISTNAFITPCDERGELNNRAICGLQSELASINIGVDPRTCAHCRLHGPVNMEFVRHAAFNHLKGKIADIRLGFATDVEQIINICDRALKVTATGHGPHAESGRTYIETEIVNLVSLGRIGRLSATGLLGRNAYPHNHWIFEKLDVAHEHFEDASKRGMIPPAPAPIPGKPCEGCAGNEGASLFNMAVALAVAAKKRVVAEFSQKASEQLYAARKAACEACYARDSKGDLLYREWSHKSPTCGVPFMQHIIRNEKKDGCGCPLRKKWESANEACPLGFW